MLYYSKSLTAKSTVLLFLGGVSINMISVFLMKLLHIPLYLDSIGTILTAALGGILPGIAVGFFSNCMGSIMQLSADPMTMYYGFLSALIAVITVRFSAKNYFATWHGRILAVLSYTMVGGALGSVVTWFLYGYSFGEGITAPLVKLMYENWKWNRFWVQFLTDTAVDFVDKSIVVFTVILVLKFLPVQLLDKLPMGYIYQRWKRDGIARKSYDTAYKIPVSYRKTSINAKITFWTIFFASVVSVSALAIGAVSYYKEIAEIMNREQVAVKMAEFLIRIGAMLFGMMILISMFTIWYWDKYLLEPISIITEQARDMVCAENRRTRVRDIRTVQTGDELEEVFQVMCRTEDQMAFHMLEVKAKNHEISKMQRNIIFTLANMVENRDGNTGDHVRRTANYVRMIGRYMEKNHIYTNIVTANYVKQLYDSAPLHDIGKIKVPDAILNKPGKLTPQEYEVVKTHTVIGKSILENSLKEIEDDSWLTMAEDMAMYHHEKWDGTGYPMGLKGESIPLCARIMAVADVFDALVSVRSYKRAFSYEEAIQIIQDGAGFHFDPQIVAAFMESQDKVHEIMNKKTFF